MKPGLYKHYKGNLYLVLYTAKHSETLEEMVVYCPLYKTEQEKQIWVRSLAMFQENLEIDGKTIPRFEYIKENYE